jgi:hypothetical protein
MVVAVTTSVIIGLVGGLVDDGRLGVQGVRTSPTSRGEPEDRYRGGLTF